MRRPSAVLPLTAKRRRLFVIFDLMFFLRACLFAARTSLLVARATLGVRSEMLLGSTFRYP
jgi:hypothetical protein